jgi:hypothetical protein
MKTLKQIINAGKSIAVAGALAFLSGCMTEPQIHKYNPTPEQVQWQIQRDNEKKILDEEYKKITKDWPWFKENDFLEQAKEWNPTNLTDKIKEALQGDDSLLFTPEAFDYRDKGKKLWTGWRIPTTNNAGIGKNGKKIEESEGRRFYRLGDLTGGEYKSCLIFDSEKKRIYPLAEGDEKLLGLPSKEFNMTSWNSNHLPKIGKNGVVMYGISYSFLVKSPLISREKRASLDATIIADPENKRKIVFKEIRDDIDISDDGRVCIIGSYDYNAQKDKDGYLFGYPGNYSMMDIENHKWIGHRSGSWEGISGDGTVVAFYRKERFENGEGYYYRFDLKTGKETTMFYKDWTRDDFVLSPDGNFCACRTECNGPSYVEVYVHSTGENLSISGNVPSSKKPDTPGREMFEDPQWLRAYNGEFRDQRDRPYSIDNQGTVVAKSGTYDYSLRKELTSEEKKNMPWWSEMSNKGSYSRRAEK